MANSGVEYRVLTINDGQNQDHVLYRLKKDWILTFRLGASLFGRTVTVFCNHPLHKNDDFQRSRYHKLQWKVDDINSNRDDSAMYIELPMVLPGSFHFYFTVNDSIINGCGYFVVDPILTYGKNDEQLPLDCIMCQTYITKYLGTFDKWKTRLAVARESGYNMIHFTPVQELGQSRSAYSLSDQRVLNSSYSTGTTKYSLDDLQDLLQNIRVEWKMLSITDIVLNHTANNSPWLQEHPECAYNLKNSPYLRPAFLLDQAIWQLALEVADGKWESKGIPREIDQEDHLQAVRCVIFDCILPQLKLHEFYTVNVEALVKKFRKVVSAVDTLNVEGNVDCQQLKIKQDASYRRLNSTVDENLFLRAFNISRHDSSNENDHLDKCCVEYQLKLEELNNKVVDLVQNHLVAAVDNIIAGMRYRFLSMDGPRIKKISRDNPLVTRYFTNYGKDLTLAEEEQKMYTNKACYIMAHNGWVMNDDPLRNFAEKHSNVYIRRELIAWGDSVKLRYGKTKDDCPYLWDHMKKYVESTARIFHGIRLDNCHSTPIHVAEFLLDTARQVRHDLYVVAELFTQNDKTDNIFVNKLGITSLIRESMSAHDAHEEGRLVYLYGGESVGSFVHNRLRPLTPSIAHALFFDLTHDNPSPMQKRSIYDLLPSTALVSMASCATGSNRGFDEFVPHHIDVVLEHRQYTSWSTKKLYPADAVGIDTGIIAAKKALNELHYSLGKAGFNQVYVDQIDTDVVAVTRHCPVSHESVVLVAFTAFQHPSNLSELRYIPPLRLEGEVQEIVFEAHLVKVDDVKTYVKGDAFINGLRDYKTQLKKNIQFAQSSMVEIRQQSSGQTSSEIVFKNFRPGAVIAFRVSVNSGTKGAIDKLRSYISLWGYSSNTSFDNISIEAAQLKDICDHLTLADLNRILFCCDEEEQDNSLGNGVYNVPKYGPLIYAGLQGLVTVLKEIHLKNDLGHPLCENLRDGNWLPDYVASRLKASSTKELGDWIAAVFSHMTQIPRYLVPLYFDAVICGLYSYLLRRVWNLMSSFIRDGSDFVKLLAIGSVILGGVVKSALLPRLSSKMSLPHPPTVTTANGEVVQLCTTLSAGLPHFSTGYMRNWGRDTFIALKGMFLITGRYDDARYIILGFGGCLRHGLIPNLLDGGKHARFNCRDAVWWWLQSIQDYCSIVPNGHSILKENVLRLFPNDDSSTVHDAVDETLEDIIHEALQKHLQGVSFRERNAGFNLDREMCDAGFNNCIGVDVKTGFVFGGNIHNCGTWMDKMGSSEAAGNKGKPATPRDGSAVEIVGLCKSALQWLIKMNKVGLYPYNSFVIQHNGKKIIKTMTEWNDTIQEHFEKHFWIGENRQCNLHPELINRTRIYKDSYKASQAFADYQLRCNFPIAMAVAPELFTPSNAWDAIQVVQDELLGPLGMKTLDSSDWAYNGIYDNSNDGNNPNIARGFNYHQGPEWLWPLGYFLRAKLHFAPLVGGKALLDETVAFVKKTLSSHYEHLQTSVWNGLPELTNRDGEFCKDSCPIQAWSMACLLEVLYDMKDL